MDERLPEHLIERMMPALNNLAERIGYGINPDLDALKEILSGVGLDKDGKALDELERRKY